jgi:protein-ribulosamine 3-kinase
MQAEQIARAVAKWGTFEQCDPVSGGCISSSFRVVIRDSDECRQRLFVKTNRKEFHQNFCCELDGLQRLSDTGAIGTPKPLTVGVLDQFAFVVMQWIEVGRKNDFEAFGRQLAQLHHQTASKRIGLEQNNFLGATPQDNTPRESWVRFVQDQRIGFQLRRAVDCHLIDPSNAKTIEAVIDSLPKILTGRDETTSLLHGDLWSGNYLFDSQGQPVLIDPAVHYGCREAEFGMLLLYGGCPPNFYDAYNDQWPMPSGWRDRCQVYVLYHLLNHLNLFGQAYLADCGRVARAILGQFGR